MSATLARSGKKTSRRFRPLVWLIGLAGIALAARLIQQWNVPVPACGFHSLTGWPCPLCGGTRAMRAFVEGDLVAALQLNPLVALAAWGLLVWIGLNAVDQVWKTKFADRVRNAISSLPLIWIAGSLVLVNWFYLIRFLP